MKKIACFGFCLLFLLSFPFSADLVNAGSISVGPTDAYVGTAWGPSQTGPSATSPDGRSSAYYTASGSLHTKAYGGGRAAANWTDTYFVNPGPSETRSVTFNMHLNGTLRVYWPYYSILHNGSYTNFLTQAQVKAGVSGQYDSELYSVYLQGSPYVSNKAVIGYSSLHTVDQFPLPSVSMYTLQSYPSYPQYNYGYSTANISQNVPFILDGFVPGADNEYTLGLSAQTGFATIPYFTVDMNTVSVGGYILADFYNSFAFDPSLPVGLWDETKGLVPLPEGSIFQLGSEAEKLIITGYSESDGYLTETYTVPVPSSVLLLSSSLVGFVISRNKKRFKR